MSSANKFGLPADFDGLPNFEFSQDEATSREESARTDKVFKVKSVSALRQEATRRVSEAKSPSPRVKR